MSLTYGFYDSDDGDRRYDARQISKIFDGLISDGVYQTVGGCLMLNPVDNGVVIKSGRAWFNHTWSYNDADYRIDADEIPEPQMFSTYYAVFLAIDPLNRANYFDIYTTKQMQEDPKIPDLPSGDGIFRYPLGYVKRTAGKSEIAESDIVNAVGTEKCPFVMALVEPAFNLDDLIRDLRAQYREDVDTDIKNLNDTLQEALKNIAGIEETTEAQIKSWYDNLITQIDENAAVNLQNQIGDLKNLKTSENRNLVGAINSNIYLYPNKLRSFRPRINAQMTYEEEWLIQNLAPDLKGRRVILNIPKRIPLGSRFDSGDNPEMIYSDETYLHPGDVILCDIYGSLTENSRWLLDSSMEQFTVGTDSIILLSSGNLETPYYEGEYGDGVINRIIPGSIIGDGATFPKDINRLNRYLEGKVNVTYSSYTSGSSPITLKYLGMYKYKEKEYRIFVDVTNPGLSNDIMYPGSLEFIWKNPDWSTAYGEHTYTNIFTNGRTVLDYDYFLLIYNKAANASGGPGSNCGIQLIPSPVEYIDSLDFKIPDLVSTKLEYEVVVSGKAPIIYNRNCNIYSDGRLGFGVGQGQSTNSTAINNASNANLVPYKLYGRLKVGIK